jgi:hypothetical protein
MVKMHKEKQNDKRFLTFHNLEIRKVEETRDGQAEKRPIISGYASVFNERSETLYGFFQEVIDPSAFNNTLTNNPDVRCLFDHDSSKVLGRTTNGSLTLRTDDKGLYIECEPPNSQWANDLVVSVERGDINQMSFGFRVKKDRWTSNGVEDGIDLREILDLELFEVSVVTFPAYTQTSVGVRSLEEIDEELVKNRLEERNKENEPKVDSTKRYQDYLKILKQI